MNIELIRYQRPDGRTPVSLLLGGDKSSQGRDIELALSYWKDWKMRNAP